MPIGTVSDIVSDRIEIGLNPPEGTVNLAQVLIKLEKKIGVNQKALDGYLKKISIPNYEDKVRYRGSEN